MAIESPNEIITIREGTINNIIIYWSSVSNADIYTLEKADNKEFLSSQIIYSGSGLTYTDPITITGHHYYRIKAIKNSPFEESSWISTRRYISITEFFWDFGEGGTSTEENPTYLYDHPGIFTVGLTASNSYYTNTEIKIDYVRVNSRYTYDIAPDPNKIMWLFGTGISDKFESGIYIKAINITPYVETGYSREDGPSLIFD